MSVEFFIPNAEDLDVADFITGRLVAVEKPKKSLRAKPKPLPSESSSSLGCTTSSSSSIEIIGIKPGTAKRNESISIDSSSCSNSKDCTVVAFSLAQIGSKRYLGLLNGNSICYMNVLLHMVFYTQPFREAILAVPDDTHALIARDSDVNLDGNHISCSQLANGLLELRSLFKELNESKGVSYVSPHALIKSLGINPDHSSCAFETWTVLIYYYLELLGCQHYLSGLQYQENSRGGHIDCQGNTKIEVPYQCISMYVPCPK